MVGNLRDSDISIELHQDLGKAFQHILWQLIAAFLL